MKGGYSSTICNMLTTCWEDVGEGCVPSYDSVKAKIEFAKMPLEAIKHE